MYHPYLDPFNGSLSLAGSAPYGMVTLPGTQSGTSVPALVDQVVQITNIEAFTEYNTALMNSESIQVRINGSTWLHEMSLPATDVSYDKLASFVGTAFYTFAFVYPLLSSPAWFRHVCVLTC